MVFRCSLTRRVTALPTDELLDDKCIHGKPFSSKDIYFFSHIYQDNPVPVGFKLLSIKIESYTARQINYVRIHSYTCVHIYTCVSNTYRFENSRHTQVVCVTHVHGHAQVSSLFRIFKAYTRTCAFLSYTVRQTTLTHVPGASSATPRSLAGRRGHRGGFGPPDSGPCTFPPPRWFSFTEQSLSQFSF